RFRDPKRTPREPEPHQVYYFATKKEYVDFLRPRHGPGVEVELGRYDPADGGKVRGWSYFYRDDDAQIDATATLYHEASHQLLFESAGRSRYEQNGGQFWVFEGLGTYFETLAFQPDGSLRVGGLVGPRIARAHELIVGQGQYVPIDRLVAMSKSRFNDEKDV